MRKFLFLMMGFKGGFPVGFYRTIQVLQQCFFTSGRDDETYVIENELKEWKNGEDELLVLTILSTD